MRLFRRPTGWLTCLALFATATLGRASSPPDPLRLVSNKADVVVKIEKPRKWAEIVYNLDVIKQLLKIDIIREAYDSTNARRGYQLLTYFEKHLGMKWPELLDRVAGGGIAIGTKFGAKPPVLAVIQGKDEALVRKFAKLALEVAGQELARQEAKERPKKGLYRKVETVQVGNEFHAAVAGSAILLSNNVTALRLAIDLHLDGDKKSLAHVAGVADARKLLPPDPLAWGWIHFEPLRKLPGAKDLLTDKRDNAILTVFYGHYLDLARRSPYLAAGLYHQKNSFLTTFRVPRGLEGIPPELSVWYPPAKEAGSLPLLEPKNVLFSSSGYLDVSKYWEQRTKLFNASQVKTFENFDKNSGRALTGVRFSKLTSQAGPHVRFVAVQQTKPGYKIKPNQLYPAGALVVDMRQPDEFSKSMETILRAAALFGGGQVGLKLAEEKRGKWNIVGYRLPEGGGSEKLPAFLRNDVNNIRLNFSPSFVRVGDQFVVSSTIELAREMVDLLDREARAAKEKVRKDSPAVNRQRFYGSGGATAMYIFRDQLLTQTILNQGASPEEAQKQVKAFTDLVGRLGVVEIKQQYNKNSYQYDIHWKLGK